MGCKDGFQNTNIIVKVAFFITTVSMLCNWLAFTTTSWTRGSSDSNMYFGIGLWRVASAQQVQLLDGIGNTRYGVVQAFGIIGFLSQNVGYLLIVLYMFKDNWKAKREVSQASAGLLIISACGWLIAVAIFGSDAGPDILHYSYAMAVIACGLGLIGGLCMVLGGPSHGQASVG